MANEQWAVPFDCAEAELANVSSSCYVIHGRVRVFVADIILLSLPLLASKYCAAAYTYCELNTKAQT
jgi:hypothetical protein